MVRDDTNKEIIDQIRFIGEGNKEEPKIKINKPGYSLKMMIIKLLQNWNTHLFIVRKRYSMNPIIFISYHRTFGRKILLLYMLHL